MMRSTCILSLGLLLLMAPAFAQADVLSVTPSQTLVLPDDHTGVMRIALIFDLSALRQGEGRRIDEALLDWTVSGVPSEETSSFSLYPATSSWTGASTSVSTAEDPAEVWEIEPLEYQRNGGLVRFDIRGAASGWAEGLANYGVVITTPDVSAEALAGQLLNARLVVRYGFFK